jgi:hypothetical protein
MGLAVAVFAFVICLFILNDLLAEVALRHGEKLSLVAWMRRLPQRASFWVYVVACVLTILFGTMAAPFRGQEGPVFFATWLTWLSLLLVLAKWVSAKNE